MLWRGKWRREKRLQLATGTQLPSLLLKFLISCFLLILYTNRHSHDPEWNQTRPGTPPPTPCALSPWHAPPPEVVDTLGVLLPAHSSMARCVAMSVNGRQV